MSAKTPKKQLGQTSKFGQLSRVYQSSYLAEDSLLGQDGMGVSRLKVRRGGGRPSLYDWVFEGRSLGELSLGDGGSFGDSG